jgi:hypothetical protein
MQSQKSQKERGKTTQLGMREYEKSFKMIRCMVMVIMVEKTP